MSIKPTKGWITIMKYIIIFIPSVLGLLLFIPTLGYSLKVSNNIWSYLGLLDD